MKIKRQLVYGTLFGIVSICVLAAICLLPLENLVHVRPSLKTYTIDWEYLYLHRLALFSLMLLLLTAITAYLTGLTDFLKGVMIVQAVFFIIAHYLYLYKLDQVSNLSLTMFLYYVNGVPHIDLGQITIMILVAYFIAKRARR